MQKPSIPKGTRDFSPAEMMRRNYIFDSIRAGVPNLRFRAARNPRHGKPLHAAGKIRRRGRQAAVQDSQFGRLCGGTCTRRTAAGVENLRKGAALRPHGALRALRRAASGRDRPAVQAVSDPACLACRPAAERPLPRILPVRRRCRGLAFAAERGGVGGDRRARFPQAGHRRDAQNEQPQDSLRYRRDDRPCRPR